MSGKYRPNEEPGKKVRLVEPEDYLNYDGDDKIISNYEMLQRIKELPPQEPIATHFPDLDTYFEGGFLPGELIVVMGSTKHGKTLFCQSVTKNLYRDQEYPVWFSYELPPRQFLNCFSLQSENITFYMPEKNRPHDIQWVMDRIKEAKIKYACQVAFIDHLHYLFDMSIMRNPSLHIGTFMRRLKTFAVQENIIIFIICHITKVKIEREDDMDATLARDSSFVNQEVDAGIFIARSQESDGVVESDRTVMKVLYSRRTGVMNKVIPLVKTGNYLEELETKHE